MIVTPPASEDDSISFETVQCLIVVAPEWFEREDFLDWRQGKTLDQGSAPACWNPAARQGEYNDVFMVFDRRWAREVPLEPGTEHCWEGSDSYALPEDIYVAIGKLLCQHGLFYGVIWLRSAAE